MVNYSRAVLVAAIVGIFLISLLVPAYADSSWTAGRPTTGLVYKDTVGGAVKLSNKYNGVDVVGTHDALSTISVDVHQFSPNYLNSGNDMYSISIFGSANSRVPHNYMIKSYGAYYYSCSTLPSPAGPCIDSGLTAVDRGAWFDLGGTFYYWGQAFNRIFVCANGWVAFLVDNSYASDCSRNGVGRNGPLPGPDRVDAYNGFLDYPQGIIAPLWKPIDPSTATGAGKISIARMNTSTPFDCADHGACAFFVIWDGVQTIGSTCRGGPCLSSFSLAIWSPSPSGNPNILPNRGYIQFGYHGVDPADSMKGTVGLNDSSGYLSTSPDRDTAVCGGPSCPPGSQSSDHGVLLEDVNFWYYHLSSTKITLTKGSALDQSYAPFLTDSQHLYGLNLDTAVAPATADLSPDIASLATDAGVSIICDVVSGGTCLAVTTGTAIAEAACHCVQSVVHNLLYSQPQQASQGFTQMTPTRQDGYMELPVAQQNRLCGIASYHKCAVDTAVYSVIQWYVPVGDSGTHSLQISFSVQAGGGLYDNSGTTWETTSVTLTLGPEGDFAMSSNCNPTSVRVGGYQANCAVLLTAGNGFYGHVSLTQSTPVSGGPQATVNVPTPGYFNLSSNSQVSTNVAITSGNTAGTYTITITASSGIRVHSLSLTVNVVTVDFTISANPTSVGTTANTVASSTITVAPVNGFTGTVNLSQLVSPSTGLNCSQSPGSITTSGTSSLTCSGSAGSYTVTVTGTSGSLSHTTQVSVQVSATSVVLGNDPNYAPDWTKISGTWNLVGGSLEGSGNYPEMKSTNTFPPDRTVTANVLTVTPGTNNWDTAWLRGKYIDNNNKIIMYLSNDKFLHVDVLKAGTACSNWCYYTGRNSTGQSPTAWHNFKMIFSGTNIKGSIDGLSAGSIDITDSIFGTFNTPSNVVLYIGLNLKADFNTVTIATGPAPSQTVLSNDPGSSDWVKICGCGIWNPVGGYIDGQNAWAELKSSSTFASDRTVQLRMVSINIGSLGYNAAWVRPKYIDNNNEVMVLLQTGGVLELDVVYQGVQRTLATSPTCNPTCLSPTAWHTFKITITGNTVNVWVDGTQYITNVTDPNGSISALGATSVALMNGGNSRSQFDSVTIS